MKKCSKCGVLKEREEFYRDTRKKDGRVSACKECSKKRPKRDREQYNKRWIANNPEKRKKITQRSRLRKYHLSNEVIVLLLDKKIPCAVCKTYERVYVDHSKITGNTRGFLCHKCNTSLGFMREDPSLIERLKLYATMCKIQDTLFAPDTQ